MKTASGHCQCKEQSPLDKEQEETLGLGEGKDHSSLLGERGGEKSCLGCPRSHKEP